MNKVSGTGIYHDLLKARFDSPGFGEEYAKAKIEAEFAVALARAREARGLTQAQLAEKMQCKQQMVARYEKGQLPALPMLQRLAAALRASIIIDQSGHFKLSLADVG